MKQGWFKMYRSIVDWEWFKEHDITCFFIYCLSNANHSDRNWRGLLIKRGQLVLSRSTACRDLGISDRRYRTIISKLIKSGEITAEPSANHTIITICNWNSYQEDSVDEMSNAKDEIIEEVQVPEEISQEPTHTDPQPETKESEPTLQLHFDTDENAVQETPKPKRKAQSIDCEFILRLYHDRCPGLPKVLKLTDKRKTKIRLRFEEMGFDYERLQAVFDKAQMSRFLRGDNNRGWKADFDWIFVNSSNWVKILEGKYDNADNQSLTSQANPYGIPSNASGYNQRRFSSAERNATTSERQKLNIVDTLAECQREFEERNFRESTGITQ
jgi:hypothetical protein